MSTLEELLELAIENHLSIDWTVDGELVFFTGVVDESKVRAADAEAEELPEPGGEVVVGDLMLD